MGQEPTIIIYGAGAIGSSLGAWLAPHCPRLSLYARGEHARKIKADGLVVYLKGEPEKREPLFVNIIDDLAEHPGADIVIVAVKNYDLEEAAADIREKLGDRPVVLGLQNGLENMKILPRYFPRAAFGVVCYNAWRDGLGLVGAEKKGPIVLGAPERTPEMKEALALLASVLGRGLEVKIEADIAGAAHSKLLMNLSNSVFTLVGHGMKPMGPIRPLKKVFLSVVLEGIGILKNAGWREVSLPGMPGWKTLRLAAMLPDFISDRIFEADFKKIGMNSMGQDVFLNGRGLTELDSLNGRVLALADDLGMEAPVNRALYQLCRRSLDQKPFTPMSAEELWEALGGPLKR
ncbi:MAG TPA: ketopantoate reductase family protein [Spirochaetes bacterium]|nr:ketopantoate reductase family protein [Spirochaetota bacterium]